MSGEGLVGSRAHAISAAKIWSELANSNEELARELLAMGEFAREDGTSYNAGLAYAAGVPPVEVRSSMVPDALLMTFSQWKSHLQSPSQSVVLQHLVRVRHLMEVSSKFLPNSKHAGPEC